MYLNSKLKAECCGCSACEQICPKSCISMEEDEEGFLYPMILDLNRCINCGLCKKVCPLESPSIGVMQAEEQSQCFYGWNKDETIRKASTSGAAFYSIARFCLEQGYSKVYGASMNEEFFTFHRATTTISQLDKLIGSKYVQSNTQEVFETILCSLRTGERVVFSGTPCQVDGLLHFVPERYRDGLLTIALVCHSTACPNVFKRYIREIGDGRRVVEFKFRDKQTVNGIESQKYTTIKYDDGSIDFWLRDPYVVAFGQGLFSRESCLDCKYTTPNRSFDITIGDFWGILSYLPERSDDVEKGISLIICHSNKGKEIIEEMNTMYIEEVPLSYAVNPIQQQLIKPLEKNPFRYTFLTSKSKRRIVSRIKAAIIKYDVYYFTLRCWRKAKRIIHIK